MKKLIISICSVIIVTGCGGGSSSSSSGGGGSGNSGGGSTTPPTGSLTLAVDCSGANCGSSGDQYTGSGVGVWYAVNKSNSDQIVDVLIRNLSGQTMYYAYTNWGTATQRLSTSTSLGNWMPSEEVDSSSNNITVVDARGGPNSSSTAYSWYLYNLQTGSSSTVSTRKMSEASLSGGAKLYVWVANNLSAITQTHVDAVTSRFAGTNGRKSIYDLGLKWIGDPWGSGASRWNNVISSSTKDIHMVIADIQPSGYLGYFYAGNNLLRSSQSDSNEALVLFIDGPELVSNTDTTWSPVTKSAMNVYSTIAHEFQHLIHYYEKTIKRSSDGYPSEVWLDELAASLFQFFYLAADQRDLKQVDGPEYRRVSDWANAPNCQLNAWTDSSTSSSGGCNMSAHYGHVGSLAAYLLRHYGPSVVKGIVQNSHTGLDALESALGAHSVSLADVQRRWGASLAIKGTSFPDKYGFPAKTHEGVAIPAIDINTLDKSAYIHSSLPSTVRHNSTVVVNQGTKNGRYETKVKVPPYTSLTIIVQRQ